MAVQKCAQVGNCRIEQPLSGFDAYAMCAVTMQSFARKSGLFGEGAHSKARERAARQSVFCWTGGTRSPSVAD